MVIDRVAGDCLVISCDVPSHSQCTVIFSLTPFLQITEENKKGIDSKWHLLASVDKSGLIQELNIIIFQVSMIMPTDCE